MQYHYICIHFLWWQRAAVVKGFDENDYCLHTHKAISVEFYEHNITTEYIVAVDPDVPDTLIESWLARIKETSRSRYLW